ncbi:MAG: type I methionyl aminopeptidase [Nitrospinota bacterium]
MAISYRTAEEIEKLRVANQIVVAAHKHLEQLVKPGVTTKQLDKEAEELILDLNGRPSFKGYRGFPATLCVAINDQVVHGIPSDRELQAGDIVGLDLGVECKGYYGDAAQTIAVGKISSKAQDLINVTRESLYQGISKIKAGGRLSDISHAIQSYVESHNYSVVKSFVGHGIGVSPHEDPQVPNFGPPGHGVKLKDGIVLAIEPMVNEGVADIEILDDDWTAVTTDGKLSAHFEHSVALLDGEAIILSEFN